MVLAYELVPESVGVSLSNRATERLVFFEFFFSALGICFGFNTFPLPKWSQSKPSSFLLSGRIYSKVSEISLVKLYYSY